MMNSPEPFYVTPAPGTLPMTDTLELAQRAAVVAEAESWVGTPYRQLGATKGVAVDCGMLLVRAWVDAGIFEPFDPRPYPPEWHLHKPEERYLRWVETMAEEVAVPQPGDIVLFQFGRCFSHGGIMVAAERLVHANAAWKSCSYGDLFEAQLALMRSGAPRPRRFFSVWDKMRRLGGVA